MTTSTQWLANSGNTYTTQQVVDLLAAAMGSSITAEILERTYRVGAMLRNGGVWFQRIS